MVRRPVDDPHWPGLWHTPGTYLRTTDTALSYETAFQRLIVDELGLTDSPQPFYVQTLFHQVARGKELAVIFGIDLAEDKTTDIGKWFAIQTLPENSVTTQHDFILAASQQLLDT